MKVLPLPRQFLRRKDARRRVDCAAVVECRGVSRTVEVVDFSNVGLRIDKIMGLTAGDRVTIAFTANLCLEGTIVWLVWHKAGISFSAPLPESDPVLVYLTERATEVERHQARAVAALAQQSMIAARRSDNA
jgi:hypothetical protein